MSSILSVFYEVFCHDTEQPLVLVVQQRFRNLSLQQVCFTWAAEL
ncbi:hypothetical protein DSUL_20071 [Desulfovibrionales bacterium]